MGTSLADNWLSRQRTAVHSPAKVITQSSHEGKQLPVLENVPISGFLAHWARPGEDAAARDKQRMQLDQ